MNNRKNRKKWYKAVRVVVFLYVLLCAIPNSFVQGASATITLDTQAEEIRVGDIVEVQLTLRADVTIGDFEAFLSYDDTIFEFYSSVSCITGGAGILKIADIGASPSQQDRTYRIYFKALEIGDCEVSLYERPVVYSYTDGVELSVTGFSKTFTVLPLSSASSDNSLSALYLVDNFNQPIVLTPSFSSNVQMYATMVEYAVESFVLSAISTDDKASVEVLGNHELSVGVNEIVVKVTAEDGSELAYTIFIRRLEETESIKEVESPELIVESGIVAQTREEVVWLTQYHSYRASEKPEDFILPDNYIETVLLINGIQITAYVDKEATEEEFLLLILQNEAGEIGWYRYDRIEQTLQRVCEEEYIVTQVVQPNDEALQEALLQYEMQQKGLIVAIAVLFGVVLALLMVILWLCIRRKNRG